MLKRYGLLYAVGLFSALVLSATNELAAQNYGTLLGHRTHGDVVYRSEGSQPMLGNVDPLMRKRYLPQHLYQE